MAYSDYERLREALREELQLWKPSEQDFETSLVKAKMHAGIQRIRLSQPQKAALFGIYEEARQEEWRQKGQQRQGP